MLQPSTARLTATHSDLLPLALFVLAALLRFSYLSEIEHNVDQAYPIWQALNTLERGQWPLVGQGTSVLFANPALTGYLYLPFVALTRSPLGAYLLVIALNSLAVPMAYRAVRSLLGHSAALVAAVLMAVNPWVIEYSRSTWVQSLLPFFTCALAWLLIVGSLLGCDRCSRSHRKARAVRRITAARARCAYSSTPFGRDHMGAAPQRGVRNRTSECVPVTRISTR